MSETEEIARAVQEAAKLGGKGLESAEKLGGFLSRVFKGSVEEAAGLLVDKLRFMRWKRLVAMSDEADRLLVQRGVTDSRAVTPRLALPILEGASMEDSDEIRSLWARLLANAMDPRFTAEIRAAFTEMIRGLEPLDARILETMYGLIDPPKDYLADCCGSRFSVRELIEHLEVSEEDSEIPDDAYENYMVSIGNLTRVQCVERAPPRGDDKRLVGLYGTLEVTLTPLGVRFIRACIA